MVLRDVCDFRGSIHRGLRARTARMRLFLAIIVAFFSVADGDFGKALQKSLIRAALAHKPRRRVQKGPRTV